MTTTLRLTLVAITAALLALTAAPDARTAVPAGNAVSVATSPAADGPRPGADVAQLICSRIYARLGFEAFTRQYGTPERCVAALAGDAEEAAAACAAAADRDACLDGRARAVADQHTLEVPLAGAVYTTGSGARVRVLSSEESAVGEEVRRAWADFLASLVHGPELASVTLQLRSPQEMREACAPSALACYVPSTQTIVAVSDDQPGAPGARSLVAHEYGHHVARNRRNSPWAALTHGTKRWATSMRICERMRAGTLRGHVLWGPAYRLSTAEGFAEAYRVLNEPRLGLSAPWVLVDGLFRPHAEALAALEADVVEPWTGPTAVTLRGRGTRSFRVSTPLDGAVRFALTAPAGTTYRVSAPATVCGQRAIVVRVWRMRGSGPFRLTVWRP